MRLILQLLIVSFVSFAGFSATAQSDDIEDVEVIGEGSEEEKSDLTDEDRTALQDATAAVGKLIDSVEADSTSRKTVKFASKKLQELKSKVQELKAEDKFAEGDAEKVLAAIGSLNKTLVPINANLKAGEDHLVEDQLPELKEQMEVIRKSIKGLK